MSSADMLLILAQMKEEGRGTASFHRHGLLNFRATVIFRQRSETIKLKLVLF